MNSDDYRPLISSKIFPLARTSGKNMTMRLARSASLRRLTLCAHSDSECLGFSGPLDLIIDRMYTDKYLALNQLNCSWFWCLQQLRCMQPATRRTCIAQRTPLWNYIWSRWSSLRSGSIYNAAMTSASCQGEIAVYIAKYDHKLSIGVTFSVTSHTFIGCYLSLINRAS